MVTKVFQSLTEAVDFARANAKWHEDNRPDWAGGTWETVEELALQGWPKGIAQAKDLAERIATRTLNAPSVTIEQDVLAYDVCGGAYDVGAYSAGVPECWARHDVQASKKGIRIVLDCDVSCLISHETITRRGIATAALAIALQARGYPVTLDVTDVSDGHSHAFVRVANAATGSPLDLDRIVYACAHPTMLRIVFSRIVGALDQNKHSWGSCSPFRDVADEARLNGPFDLYIGAANVLDAKRWQDGGEAWVLAEYLRQTS